MSVFLFFFFLNLSFYIYIFCFKDKIQKSLQHTGCRVQLLMCLQIGPEQFEYLYSWKSVCNTVPQSPLNSAKSLIFEGFLMASNLRPRLPKAASPKDFHNGKYRSADLALASCLSKDRRSVGGTLPQQGSQMLPTPAGAKQVSRRGDYSMVSVHAHVHACHLKAHLLVSWDKAEARVQTSGKCHICMGLKLGMDSPFSTM